MAGLLKMLQFSKLPSVSRQLSQARPSSQRGMATAARAALGKKELVASVAQKAGLTKDGAEQAVNAVLETIVETVTKGEKVQVVGFGTFERRNRAARKGRNPATGAELQIPESVVPVFSAGRTFREKVKAGKK